MCIYYVNSVNLKYRQINSVNLKNKQKKVGLLMYSKNVISYFTFETKKMAKITEIHLNPMFEITSMRYKKTKGTCFFLYTFHTQRYFYYL